MSAADRTLDVSDRRGEIFALGHVQFTTVRRPSAEYRPGAVFEVRQDRGGTFGRFASRGRWVVLSVADTLVGGEPRLAVTLHKLAEPEFVGGYRRFQP